MNGLGMNNSHSKSSYDLYNKSYGQSSSIFDDDTVISATAEGKMRLPT